MKSTIASAMNLKYAPVAILFSDTKPEGAMQFEQRRWGCVMAAFAAVAEKGRTYVFDKETYGCQGGGVGLGFGNAYTEFIGGMDGFYGFLSTGNGHSEKGRATAEACSAFLRGTMREHFLHGERYRKTPELVEKYVSALPIIDVPTKYVVFKQLSQVADSETPQSIVFLANPDQVSALTILANYGRPHNENAAIPHVAACQSIGICTYAEGKSATPRAIVGLTDLSARRTIRRLGKDLMTVSVPFKMHQEMEANVPESFLDCETWKSLQDEAN